MFPASGAKPDLFRAEAWYGMLATLCFPTRLAELTGYHEPRVGILATDSQSLLDTVLAQPHTTDNHMAGYFGGHTSAVKQADVLRVDEPEWDIASEQHPCSVSVTTGGTNAAIREGAPGWGQRT